MAIRDFAANRSFSGNGLWQWDEKQKASASRGVVLGRRVRAAVGVAIPTTANSINHIHYPTRADHQACRGTYLGAINVVHRSLVRCAVLGPCGGLREDEHGIAVTVPTKNPNRFEVEPQPEPEQATWAKLSVTVERSDGGIVDAEIIRPRSWILANGLCAGRMLPLNIPELEVSGLALVTAIKDCPPIADGEGSVVTSRFVTREVHVVASVDVLGADGTVETITGTTIHPVWSVDRQEWVPLAELAEGETLQGLDGLAVVLSVSLSRVSQAVYNIEVHGEHVYQVGELGLVVHIDDVANLFASTPGHAGTHTLALVDCLIDVMIDRHSTESMISYPVSLGF